MIKKGFRYFIDKVFFNRKYAAIFCVIVAVAFYIVEYSYCVENLFSASGAIFTLAGLFLNIKLTAHWHLRLPNGEPLPVESKYYMITGAATFGGDEPKNFIEKTVKDVESDEICGAFLMVVGTIIWGFGSYLI